MPTLCRLTQILVLLLLLGLSQAVPIQASQESSGSAGADDASSRPSGRDSVRIAILNNFPPFSFAARQKLMGFTVDYIELLSEKTGLDFQLVQGTWEQNLERFKNGQVDLITAMSYTEERTDFARFTDPYYIIPTVVYARDGDFNYQDVNDLKGKTVGIESGVFYKKFLQQYPAIHIKEIEDTNELMRQLSFAEVDAVITNINIGNFMIKKHMLENVALAGRINIPGIKDEDLRIGVRKELAGLHAMIQEGLNRITPREYKALQDRWVGFSPEDLFQGSLLPAELDLINELKNKVGGLRLASQVNWHPVDFLDPKGNHDGIAKDIFTRVSKTLNLPMIVHETDSLDDSMAAVIDGRADLLPAVVPTRDRRDRLRFTKPYLSLPLVLATRDREIFIDDLSLLEDKRIVYAQDSLLNVLRPASYPDLRFNRAGSVQKGLQRVLDKRDFAFVGTIPAITYAIHKYNMYDIKVAGTLQERLPIAAAVRKGDQELLQVAQKGLSSMPMEQRESILDNWISIRFEEKAHYGLVWAVAAAAFLFGLIVVLWTRKVQALNDRVSRANELLAEKNRELEELSITDSLTGLFNRSKLEAELDREQHRFTRYGTRYAIVMLDIDGFKAINDTLGHQAGDGVLMEVAGIIKSRCRQVDVAGRWGGEEFLLVCPATGVHGAARLAEDIRTDILTHTFQAGTRVTVSGGVAAATDQADGVEELLRLADSRLYLAKETKNRVVPLETEI